MDVIKYLSILVIAMCLHSVYGCHSSVSQSQKHEVATTSGSIILSKLALPATDTSFLAGVSQQGDFVYWPTKNMIYCYTMDGKLRWKSTFSGTIAVPLVTSDEELFVLHTNGVLSSYCIDNGALQWELQTIDASITNKMPWPSLVLLDNECLIYIQNTTQIAAVNHDGILLSTVTAPYPIIGVLTSNLPNYSLLVTNDSKSDTYHIFPFINHGLSSEISKFTAAEGAFVGGGLLDGNIIVAFNHVVLGISAEGQVRYQYHPDFMISGICFAKDYACISTTDGHLVSIDRRMKVTADCSTNLLLNTGIDIFSNNLVAARYQSTAYLINRHTGGIEWVDEPRQAREIFAVTDNCEIIIMNNNSVKTVTNYVIKQ